MLRSIPFAALSLLVAVSACKKSDDTGEPVFLPPDEPTGDTADDVPPPKIPTEVRLLAFVAWDADNQQIVHPILEGEEGFISAFQVRLYEGGIDSDYCQVSIFLDGLEMSADAKVEGFAWGVDIPPNRPEWYETCTEGGWDIDQFFEGSKPEDWVSYDYSLRFFSPLSTDLEDWLTPDTPTADFNIYNYTGGGFSTEAGGLSTDDDSNYWYGWPMVGNEVDRDNTDPLDSRYTMVDAGGDMVQGYFVFDQNVYWTLGDGT